jgi:hypothetical protein
MALTPDRIDPLQSLADELRAALGAHGRWKIRFHAAIEGQEVVLPLSSIISDRDCEVGRFLFERLSPAFRRSGPWRKCVDFHAEFHRSAWRIWQMAREGKREAALEAIGPGSRYAALSSILTSALLEWIEAVKSLEVMVSSATDSSNPI